MSLHAVAGAAQNFSPIIKYCKNAIEFKSWNP